MSVKVLGFEALNENKFSFDIQCLQNDLNLANRDLFSNKTSSDVTVANKNRIKINFLTAFNHTVSQNTNLLNQVMLNNITVISDTELLLSFQITQYIDNSLLLNKLHSLLSIAYDYISSHPDIILTEWLYSLDDQRSLRAQLQQSDGIAFIANGSILPPIILNTTSQYTNNTPTTAEILTQNAAELSKYIPFQSPITLEREFVLPHCGAVKGMLIPKGVVIIAGIRALYLYTLHVLICVFTYTLLVVPAVSSLVCLYKRFSHIGGGYHGKSTLLNALKRGNCDKFPHDPASLVVIRAHTYSIRSEEGRYVGGIDISPFISTLPKQAQVTPTLFRSIHSSGSTSMASSVIEGLENRSDHLSYTTYIHATIIYILYLPATTIFTLSCISIIFCIY